jgi:hypothetical protein
MTSQHQKNSNKATTDHSAKAQCQIFLAYLIKHGFISSINARKFLDIIWSPARVHELKKQGYQIETVRIEQDGHKGIAEYHLVTKSFIQCDLFEGGSHE